MDDAAQAVASSPAARRSLGWAMATAWAGFWLLMMVAEMRNHPQGGWEAAWRALVLEGSSALLATAVLLVQWHQARRLDRWLDQPARWFGTMLAITLPLSLLFVPLVHLLRVALYAAAGQAYPHEPLAEVVLPETARFAVFYLLFCGVQFGVRSYFAWNGARLQAERERALAREAQLLLLAQQLQPHFLFNALNTISALIHADPDRADALLTRLATLLRAATDLVQRPQQPLHEELRLLHAYAEIMGERFADRVSIAWQVDAAALACPVPTLSLQPLLENCFRHVVERRREPTRIVVQAGVEAGRLRVTVRDDGGTLAPSAAPGVGLGNVMQRLQALHGKAAWLRLEPLAGGGVAAVMELPCAC
ncbi:sensor histidine kinase [Caldimonas thermodepolymerans]|uniref:sensor histidine kinase n=1 Tax=Caldimonas thermodepolymerans TaxID=215580 RepID=UPI002235A4D6|nr:histidine kinase [Caldimonas thermodepolymerans]UZG43382.1 histidine kinase [Caldimonas thermodepolymerans]